MLDLNPSLVVRKEITYCQPTEEKILTLEIKYKPNEPLEITYFGLNESNKRSIKPGVVISDDKENLWVPATESQYGLCSIKFPNEPAVISCLSSFWGGHLIMNGLISQSDKQAAPEKTTSISLIDYILFEWAVKNKGPDVIPELNPGGSYLPDLQDLQSADMSTTITVHLAEKGEQSKGNKEDLSLTIQANYKKQQFFYTKNLKDPNSFMVLNPDQICSINDVIVRNDNILYILKDACIILHTQGDYDRLITFSGTVEDEYGCQLLRLNNIIIHQWDLGELI